MARFSSFVYTERDSEVHRLGHKYIKNQTTSSFATIDTQCHYIDKKSEYAPDTEYVNVEIKNGYSEYFHSAVHLFQVKNGVIILPDDFQERVERWNAEVRKHYNRKEGE